PAGCLVPPHPFLAGQTVGHFGPGRLAVPFADLVDHPDQFAADLVGLSHPVPRSDPVVRSDSVGRRTLRNFPASVPWSSRHSLPIGRSATWRTTAALSTGRY